MWDAKCGGVGYCSNNTFGLLNTWISWRCSSKWRSFIHGYIFKIYLTSNLGNTGRIKLPNELSCVIKYPADWVWALCKAALWADVNECVSVVVTAGPVYKNN